MTGMPNKVRFARERTGPLDPPRIRPVKASQSISLQHLGANLDRSAPEPLYRQLEDRIAALVLDGTLARGCKLPASRDLARSIGVSRNTIMEAYEQLLARGILRTGQGSGTYVESIAAAIPHLPPGMELHQDDAGDTPPPRGLDTTSTGRPFRINHPAINAFPIREWTKNTSRNLRKLANESTRLLAGEGSSGGYPPLRHAIAEHLRLARGVNCSAANVLVFGGADQALDIILRVIVGRSDAVWCEDPSHRGCVAALSPHCGEVVPVPVDEDGLDVAKGIQLRADAKAVYVFPSNHIPLSIQLNLQRRHELLDWAERSGAFIVECDYDSELRYSGQPLPSIKSLDLSGRVVHVGTFSKIMYPSLRIGYAVVPDQLVDACIDARSVANRYPVLDQMLVADFIESGALARHVRRMRNVYAKRQVALLAALQQHLGDRVRASAVRSGMQLVAWLGAGNDDRRIAEACANQGLEVAAVSEFAIAARQPAGMVLGFAGFDDEQIDQGVKGIAQVLDRLS
jgi:GntR family transcriptional regulator/MocR family aminotransferase